MKILLASQSPRRKELLLNLGFDFEVVNTDCEEIIPEEIMSGKAAAYLSVLKARSFRNLADDEVLLTADTVVAFKERFLGKPENENDARAMLKLLSGNIHQVYTAVTVKTSDKIFTETDVADVEFEVISDEEIDFYIKNYQPFDKAGSYGIQEWIGMAKVKSIKGSFYTVMGFPTHIVYQILKNL